VLLASSAVKFELDSETHDPKAVGLRPPATEPLACGEARLAFVNTRAYHMPCDCEWHTLSRLNAALVFRVGDLPKDISLICGE